MDDHQMKKIRSELQAAIDRIHLHDKAIERYDQMTCQDTTKNDGITEMDDLLAMRFGHLRNVREEEQQKMEDLVSQLFSSKK